MLVRVLAVMLCLGAVPAVAADPLVDSLRANGKPPIDYILSKLDDHKVVIVGESHWVRHDVELIAALVPDLRRRGVALATELLPSERQKEIDALLGAAAWDEQLANSILRVEDWPYVQYRDILHAAWRANQTPSDMAPVRIMALGPPRDWRAMKIDYDAFMAQGVIDYLSEPSRRVLMYCGMHHAFTRYLQVERRGRGRATEFMTRTGNILWRRYGQDVFLIALHKPEMCGNPPESVYCLPFGGAIDCAAAALGRPVAFDILGSPLAETKFPAQSYYAFGHPLLRFIDYADGYIWFEPIDATRMVDLIPMEQFAPEDARDPEKAASWKKHADDLARPLDRPSWKGLANWRDACGSVLSGVTLVSDEAEAVLAVLLKRKAGEAVTDADWERVLSSEGYIRLKKRETGLKRPFDDADFKSFVLSDGLLEKSQVLDETLAKWKRADVGGAAARALAYLPEGTRIAAKIYPVIKPRDNSFVFELQTDPAVFLYLDPKLNREQFENTLAHELHHVGYASSCLPILTSEQFMSRPSNILTVLHAIGSFGEGVAMLAAAGGPDVHPHSVSRPEERERWDRDVARFNDDLKRVERFFLDILRNRITEEEIGKINASFFGVQGPWYTVGWTMAATIEKAFGRQALVATLCDPQAFLSTYNRAAERENRTSRNRLALWSTDLIKDLDKVKP